MGRKARTFFIWLFLTAVLSYNILIAAGNRELLPSGIGVGQESAPDAPDTVISEAASGETEPELISYDRGCEAPPVLIGYATKKIYVKDSYQLRVLSGAKVTWQSSDPEIASVDENGVVTANKAGVATVTATDSDGNSDQCVIQSQKVAYLTMDDNPTESTTPRFIGIYDRYGIKITLFLCACEGHDGMYEQYYQAGHTLALHGFSHNEGKMYSSESAFINNIEAEREFLLKVTSAEYVENVIRFPTGSAKHKELRETMLEKGYRVFDWTALLNDSYHTKAQECFDELKKGIDSDCEVVLMHHKGATLYALPDIIEYLSSLGYEFATITEETAMYYF